jgi:hypothetical protein
MKSLATLKDRICANRRQPRQRARPGNEALEERTLLSITTRPAFLLLDNSSCSASPNISGNGVLSAAGGRSHETGHLRSGIAWSASASFVC